MVDVERYDAQARFASTINVVAGIWLVICSFLLPGFNAVSQANDLLLGIMIALVAASRAYRTNFSPIPSWINVVFGLWVLASPWLLGFSRLEMATWNNFIVGLVVAACALWSALVTQSAHPGFTGTA